MSLELENGLDAFNMEAPAVAPVRTDVRPAHDIKRGPAKIHDLTAVGDVRLFNHISKESADTRRRISDLKFAIDTAMTRQAADLDRLTTTLKLAIYTLVAIGIAQIGLTIWMTVR